MRMYDIITRKKNGAQLSREEISFFIHGYTEGSIPDYQASALLMAIWFRGMTTDELAILTDEMINSGERVDLSSIGTGIVDKHSTGGVGDKTSFIAPMIAAACGVPVAMMSGRGLGHTGGTLDKMESVPGMRTAVSIEEFRQIIRQTGICISGQTGQLVPADKRLYALRDVTATVDSIPLIAASIMSKKLAAGADKILLDVKTGKGAFMQKLEDSVKLAETMVQLGCAMGRETVALITDMNQPLGNAFGNACEIQESVQTLRGEGPADLTRICLEIAAGMLRMAGKGSPEQCMERARQALDSGAALAKFRELTAALGGDVSCLDDLSRFPRAACEQVVSADRDGYLTLDAYLCGQAAVSLGAGRMTKEESVDHAAGVLLYHKEGDFVSAGEPIAILSAETDQKLAAGTEVFQKAAVIQAQKPEMHPLLYARITDKGVEWLQLQ